jgi:hypothetical protein
VRIDWRLSSSEANTDLLVPSTNSNMQPCLGATMAPKTKKERGKKKKKKKKKKKIKKKHWGVSPYTTDHEG